MRYYSIQHLTRFDYAHSVCESAMEVRMQPRGDGNQRCLTFSLSVSPRCRVFSYRDHLANQVHHFDIPGDHRQLVIVAHSLVEQQPLGQIPNRLTPAAWQELDVLLAQGDFWEMLLPSTFAEPTEALRALAAEWRITRRDDPLSMLHEISRNVFNNFEYLPTQHEGGFADRCGAGREAWRVPGLCAHHDCAGADGGDSLPLCERLSVPWR